MSSDRDYERHTTSLGVASVGNLIKTGQMSLQSFMEFAAAAKFDYLELCDRVVTPENRAEVPELLAQYEMQSPSFAARSDFADSTLDLEAEVDHALASLQSAATIGARVVRVWTGAGNTNKEARTRVETAFASLVQAAEELDLHLAIETHGGLSNDVDFLRRLVSTHGSRRLGVCLDWGNIPFSDRSATASAVIDIVTHLHVKTRSFDSTGRESEVDADNILEMVRTRHVAPNDLIHVVEYEGSAPYATGVEQTLSMIQRLELLGSE